MRKIENTKDEKKNKYYKVSDGVLFDDDEKELLWCCKDKTGKYVIPETVETIKTSAFRGCDNLKRIVLPSYTRKQWEEALERGGIEGEKGAGIDLDQTKIECVGDQ